MGREIWKYDRFYNFCRSYAGLCTRTQFSSIEVSGIENIPKDAALIFAPNHCVAMMDPMVLSWAVGEPVGYGCRSDVFKNPTVAKFMYRMKMLPVARERNGMSEIAKNFQTIEDTIDCLRHGMPFCMYSEGTHRPERGLLPIKKGIFKLAVQAHEELKAPVYLVPVGIGYEFFFRAMGKVSVKVGTPLEIGEYLREREGEPLADVYKELCGKFHAEILELLGPYPQRNYKIGFSKSLALILLFPLWLACTLASLTIWLPEKLILAPMEDKAWAFTITFFLRAFQPLLWPFFSLSAYLGIYYRKFLKIK